MISPPRQRGGASHEHGRAVDRSASMHTYAEPPVTFVRGEGSELWDTDGKRYLDFLSGLAVTSLGHAHPAVAEAVAEQARTLLHVSNLFGNAVGPEVAVTLDRLVGGGPSAPAGRCSSPTPGPRPTSAPSSWPASGPGRGRHVVVSTWDAFHGRTLATLHATGQPAKHAPFAPLPEGFEHVAYDDLDALDAALRPGAGGRRAARAHPGGGGGHRAVVGLPRRRARAVQRAGHPAHGGRGPDRPRPHRPVVRASSTPAIAARRRHHGQGARQRRAHRRVLGPGRGGGGLRARATTAAPSAASRWRRRRRAPPWR